MITPPALPDPVPLPLPLPPAPSVNLRRNERQRHIVDHAIAVQEHTNTIAALEYMKSNDVPAGVIERVLLEPSRRRPAPSR